MVLGNIPHYFFFLFIFFTFSQAWAQGLVEALEKNYKTIDQWRASFVQETHVDLLDRVVTKKGTLAIKKPGKLRLEYTEAPKKYYISDGKKIWVVEEGDPHVEVYKKVGKLISQEALSFLGGLGDLKSDFNATEETSPDRKELMTRDGELGWVILVPRDSHSSFQKIAMGVDLKTKQVKEMTLFNVSANKSHYIFSHMEVNIPLGENLFTYDSQKGK